MNLDEKELREALNRAWRAGHWWHFLSPSNSFKKDQSRRYRDVTKILKEVKDERMDKR